MNEHPAKPHASDREIFPALDLHNVGEKQRLSCGDLSAAMEAAYADKPANMVVPAPAVLASKCAPLDEHSGRIQHCYKHHRQHRKVKHMDDMMRRTKHLLQDAQNSSASSNSAASTASTEVPASDSALSQSQTTLGSTHSSTASCTSSNHSHSSQEQLDSSSSRYSSLLCMKKASRKRPSSSEPPPQDLHNNGNSEDDDDENAGDCSLSPDHFAIEWTNLSHRVPERRIDRLLSYFKSTRVEKQAQTATQKPKTTEQLYEGAPTTANITHILDDEPRNAEPEARAESRDVIFSRLNGCVRSGQLTAILGPSGAGKTTLLKCITSQTSRGVSGRIFVRGGSEQSHKSGLKVCTIPQKDYLFDNLTVMENLLFASRLKNTQSRDFDHKANVCRVAKLLGLSPCMDLKGTKLSGGQYKRVSIAQELLSKPDVLILDEPTSGLDSQTCLRTVNVLRELVDLSRSGVGMAPLAILMTIHQPQAKIFNLFHRVYVLSSMGECVYEGKPERLITTVADCCKLLPPPDDLNPASFIIDLASEVYGSEPLSQLVELQRANTDARRQKLLAASGVVSVDLGGPTKKHNPLDIAFSQVVAVSQLHELQILPPEANPVLHEADLMQVQDGNDDDDTLYVDERLRRRHNFERTFWLHTCLLIKRLWISSTRDPLLATTRIAFHLIMPFIFYLVYSQKSGAANACPHVEREYDVRTLTDDISFERLAVQNNELILSFENTSLFFLLLYSFSMCVLALTALSFPLNMQILLKETSNGWYSMPRFVMAKTLADLPVELSMPAISVAIAYYLTGQPSSYMCWRMLAVTAVMTLCSLISQTQGLLFGAYFMNNIQAAVFISQASSLPWIMLSGFTTRVSELSKVFQWLSFASIYRLGIESIIAVRYGYGMCPCDESMINDKPARVIGIPDQVKSLVRYYLESAAESANSDSASSSYGANDTQTAVSVTTTIAPQHQQQFGADIFDRLATLMSRANTYGTDVVTCHDVRPFIMSAREVDEHTAPMFFALLVLIFLILKVLLFWVVRVRTS